MADVIYMPLLDEGVDVWRPVPAWKIDAQTYIVLRPDDYDPEDERWTFPPGSTVECEPRRIDNDDVLAAVRSHVTGRRTA